MKNIDINKVSEGVDYELAPVDVDNEQAWDVRILRGTYTETVIRYGSIRFDGERECLAFNFTVIRGEGCTSDEEELQLLAGDILEDILDKAAREGWMVTGDDVERNKSGTNDSEESTH